MVLHFLESWLRQSEVLYRNSAEELFSKVSYSNTNLRFAELCGSTPPPLIAIESRDSPVEADNLVAPLWKFDRRVYLTNINMSSACPCSISTCYLVFEMGDRRWNSGSHNSSVEVQLYSFASFLFHGVSLVTQKVRLQVYKHDVLYVSCSKSTVYLQVRWNVCISVWKRIKYTGMNDKLSDNSSISVL